MGWTIHDWPFSSASAPVLFGAKLSDFPKRRPCPARIKCETFAITAAETETSGSKTSHTLVTQASSHRTATPFWNILVRCPLDT